MSEEYDYFEDREDENGELLEPPFGVIDVNFRSVVNFVKLAVSQMRKQKRAASLTGGSIVITSSATAYTPEQNLPVYSASKFAVSDSQFLFWHVVWGQLLTHPADCRPHAGFAISASDG